MYTVKDDKPRFARLIQLQAVTLKIIKFFERGSAEERAELQASVRQSEANNKPTPQHSNTKEPPDSLLPNCIIGSCAEYGDLVRVGCRDCGGYAASIVSLLNIRFSQVTAIRCMQGYDAAS